jgi:hypothetical protein
LGTRGDHSEPEVPSGQVGGDQWFREAKADLGRATGCRVGGEEAGGKLPGRVSLRVTEPVRAEGVREQRVSG